MAEEQQRLRRSAGAHVEFQDFAIYRRGDAAAGDFGLTRFDGRIGWRDARRSVRAAKRRRSSSSRLITFCRASVSARLSWFSKSASSAAATASAARRNV